MIAVANSAIRSPGSSDLAGLDRLDHLVDRDQRLARHRDHAPGGRPDAHRGERVGRARSSSLDRPRRLRNAPSPTRIAARPRLGRGQRIDDIVGQLGLVGKPGLGLVVVGGEVDPDQVALRSPAPLDVERVGLAVGDAIGKTAHAHLQIDRQARPRLTAGAAQSDRARHRRGRDRGSRRHVAHGGRRGRPGRAAAPRAASDRRDRPSAARIVTSCGRSRGFASPSHAATASGAAASGSSAPPARQRARRARGADRRHRDSARGSPARARAARRPAAQRWRAASPRAAGAAPRPARPRRRRCRSRPAPDRDRRSRAA